jgi:hypothetical protein
LGAVVLVVAAAGRPKKKKKSGRRRQWGWTGLFTIPFHIFLVVVARTGAWCTSSDDDEDGKSESESSGLVGCLLAELCGSSSTTSRN